MMNYRERVDEADKLPMLLHWLVGVAFCLYLVTLDGPGLAHLFDHGVFPVLVWVGGGGLVLSLGSRLLMFALPWPYAWLSRWLGVAA